MVARLGIERMSRRTEQVNELLREELSGLLAREVRDPRVSGIVSITGVDVSPDLRHAKVWVSVYGSDEDRASTMEALHAARAFRVARTAQQPYRLRSRDGAGESPSGRRRRDLWWWRGAIADSRCGSTCRQETRRWRAASSEMRVAIVPLRHRVARGRILPLR